MWKRVLVAFSALFVFVAGAQLVGGFSNIDISDSGAQNALDYAVAQHNKGTNDLYIYKPTTVVKVQRQVVAGFKYVITAVMERTNCRKGGASETCDILTESPNARSFECTFTVWCQAWKNFIKVTEQTCQTRDKQGDFAV